MKNVKYLLIAMMVAPMFFVGTGCGPDDTVKPTPVDTSDTTEFKDSVTLGFTIGVDKYQAIIDADRSGSYYNSSTDITTIEMYGQSTKGEFGASETGPAAMELSFKGKMPVDLNEMSADFDFRIITGEGAKKQEYQTDPTNQLTVKITEYGEPGELVKGTFSGKLKTNLNSYPVNSGKFEILRTN